MEGKSVTYAFNILNFKWFIEFIYENRVTESYPKKKSHRSIWAAHYLHKTGVISYPTDNSPTGVFQRVTKSLEKTIYRHWFHSRSSARPKSTTVSGVLHIV